ncbi:MAG: arylsulfatase [Planctomycetia bacterium]|nr:arylsulfatase [Planctomycetia bacterium]
MRTQSLIAPKLIIALTLFCALFIAPTDLRAQLPNVVVILADDLGWGDLGCYGAKHTVTPHLDRLAREGMRFTDAHSTSAVCTPTRYGLLTGRYAWRTRLKRGTLIGDSPALIEEGRLTLARLFKGKGYATAAIGKWHLGLGSDAKTDFAKTLRPGPLEAGFDSFFGIPASLDMVPYVYVENDRVLALPTAQSEKSPKSNYFDGVFWREGPAAPGFRHRDVLPELTRRAEVFIHSQTAERPFFLYLALTSPHTPWVPTGEFQGSTALGEYGDFVTQTDAAVGRVLATLEARKLADNTLIVFTSDNGAIPLPAQFAASGHKPNGPWRGQKADCWEAGHRVPYLVRWPVRTPAGSTCAETICHTDLPATMAALIGRKLPDDSAEDSFNLLPLYLGAMPEKPVREATVHHSGDGAFAIRQGKWKAISHLGSGGFSQPKTEQPAAGGPTGQLYDLETDPGETRNLWLESPDVVARLTALLARYQTEGRSRPRE